MQWLEKIRPPRFLRYIFYRIYKHDIRMWGKESASPMIAASLFVGITHFFQFLFVIVFIGYLFSIDIWGEFFTGSKKSIYIIFLLLSFIIVWLFYTYKKKYLNYIKEFEDETKLQKRKSIIYLFIYLFISIPVLMITIGYLIVLMSPNYNH